MKVISLNTWGGLAGKEALLSFFEKHKEDTDIFCLQEVWSGPYQGLDGQMTGGRPLEHERIMIYGLQETSAILSDHVPYFRPHHGDNYGLLVFVKKDFVVLEEGEVFVYKEKGYIPDGDVGNHARNIQYVTVQTDKGPKTIINFHGLWNGKGKTDSEDRLLQSDNIIAFLRGRNEPIVFCGDFNLEPNTESLKKLEDFGLRNLIKEHGITSTRTSFYTKEGKFADYALISEEVTPKRFEVLADEVSDHAPLLVEFE